MEREAKVQFVLVLSTVFWEAFTRTFTPDNSYILARLIVPNSWDNFSLSGWWRQGRGAEEGGGVRGEGEDRFGKK